MGAPLHEVVDFPGHFPNGARVVAVRIEAGADPNAAAEGTAHTEPPQHGAASCDDTDVADALIAGGANLEAPGAVIGGGTPLDAPVAFGR